MNSIDFRSLVLFHSVAPDREMDVTGGEIKQKAFVRAANKQAGKQSEANTYVFFYYFILYVSIKTRKTSSHRGVYQFATDISTGFTISPQLMTSLGDLSI